MKIGASYEKLCEHVAILRAGPNHVTPYDPYDLCIVAISRGDALVEIQGLDKRMPPRYWRAFEKVLYQNGIRKIKYERVIDPSEERGRWVDYDLQERK